VVVASEAWGRLTTPGSKEGDRPGKGRGGIRGIWGIWDIWGIGKIWDLKVSLKSL
jgi:hypothetical protein